MDNSFLYNLGFSLPTIENFEKENFQVVKTNSDVTYYQDGLRWMCYDFESNIEAFQFYSHFHFAKGHCCCTGLGFLIRENWLLTKKDVTKITVLEKNENIIKYHYKFNPKIMERLEVIHTDAYEYTGSCDTLLIDNFEGGIQHEPEFCLSVKSLCENINSSLMWFWPLEFFLTCHYRSYLGISLIDLYNKFRNYFGLYKLPVLTEDEIFYLCYVYNKGNFSKCYFN